MHLLQQERANLVADRDHLRDQIAQWHLAAGAVTRFMAAADTLICWRDVIRQTPARSFLRLLCYTFDLIAIQEALVEALRRGVRVSIVADRIQTYGANTRQQHNMLARLADSGVQLHTRSGAQGGMQGICHAKLLYNATTMVIGSCNFTRNSQNNFEITAEIHLHDLQQAHEVFRQALVGASPFVCNATHRAYDAGP